MTAGARVPLHRHGVEEIIICLSGAGECSIDGAAAEEYQAGSVLIIPVHVPHTIRNPGPGILRQIAFFPNPSPQTEWLEPKGSLAES